MSGEPLTPEEIDSLRELLTVAKVVKEEAEYKLARRLVLRTWKKVIIALGGAIAFVLVTREQLREMWHWFVN